MRGRGEAAEAGGQGQGQPRCGSVHRGLLELEPEPRTEYGKEEWAEHKRSMGVEWERTGWIILIVMLFSRIYSDVRIIMIKVSSKYYLDVSVPEDHVVAVLQHSGQAQRGHQV